MVTSLVTAYVVQDFGDQDLFMKEMEHTSKHISSQCDARGFEVRVSCRGASCASVNPCHTLTHEHVTTTMQSGIISNSYCVIKGLIYFYIYFKTLVVQPLLINISKPIRLNKDHLSLVEYVSSLDKLQINTNKYKFSSASITF